MEIGNCPVKEVNKANGGKVENPNRIKDGSGRLVMGEVDVQRIWKDLHNIDTQEQVWL